MKKINLGQKDIIHFVGIGGIGMSGLAQIMKNMGFKIQGSDQNRNKNTISCSRSGIKIFIGHLSNNIKKASIVVGVTEKLIEQFDASDLVKIGVSCLGGKGGGGRKDMAQGGGPNYSNAQTAIKKMISSIKNLKSTFNSSFCNAVNLIFNTL